MRKSHAYKDGMRVWRRKGSRGAGFKAETGNKPGIYKWYRTSNAKFRSLDFSVNAKLVVNVIGGWYWGKRWSIHLPMGP